MTLSSERYTVQIPFIRYAQEAGWTYLSREEALRLRGERSIFGVSGRLMNKATCKEKPYA